MEDGNSGGGGIEFAGGIGNTSFDDLPEGCIVNILSFATPVDALRLSRVSSVFRSSANSDALWDRFLPSDYDSIIPNSAELPSFSSKKELFRALCSRPIFFDDCKKSLWLDKESGKKCYMLGARGLSIESSDSPHHWAWIKDKDSRFPEVAELKSVPALDIRGEITVSMLSPGTNYAAYLVYKLQRNAFDCLLVETSVGVAGADILAPATICLNIDVEPFWHHHRNSNAVLGLKRPKKRRDKWLEIELGEYFNEAGKSGGLEPVAIQVKAGGETRGCVVIEGIEIRPAIG
ncbi:unnamed protein product [Linum tenue]|uniref:F-box domain-containing protein n=1 Tax=Linum tenue TaxID=586396 RepID=A0AAV0NCX4_9ROSI|nr:unnamed protein product [Linum tenue]